VDAANQTVRQMTSPTLPLALALSAAAADGGGLHRLAFYLILAAIPPAAGVALSCAGDLAEGKPVTLRVIGSGGALALLVLSSAVRANAAPASVPPIAVVAVAGCILAYAAIVLARVAVPQRQSVPVPVRDS
jgi:hypothetical protein